MRPPLILVNKLASLGFYNLKTYIFMISAFDLADTIINDFVQARLDDGIFGVCLKIEVLLVTNNITLRRVRQREQKKNDAAHLNINRYLPKGPVSLNHVVPYQFIDIFLVPWL